MRASLVIGLFAMVAGSLGVVGTSRAQVVQENGRLARLAADADTAAQHASVARAFRDRADALDAEAADHEAEVRNLEARRFPYQYKLPSNLQPEYQKRQRAIDARRAARGARALAQRHSQLAVDLLAVP